MSERPTGLRRLEWAITVGVFVLSLLGSLNLTERALAALVWIIFIAASVLVAIAFRDTVERKVMGKLLLVGSVWLLFWLEAFLLAIRDPLFPRLGTISMVGDTLDTYYAGQAVALIGTFQLALMIGYEVKPRFMNVTSFLPRLRDGPERRTAIVCAVLAYVSFLPLLYSYRFDVPRLIHGILAARSGEYRASRDPGLLTYLIHVGWAGTAMLLAYAGTRRGKMMWILFLAALPPLLPIFLSGSRINLTFVLVPMFIVLIRRATVIKRKHVVGAGAAALVIFVVFWIQLATRGAGWTDPAGWRPPDLGPTLMLGQFIALIFAVYYVPGVHPFFHEPAAPYFFIHWIPRPLWPDKPVMGSWISYNDAYVQGAVLNVTPSIIGQYWINWGVLGVIGIGLAFGLACYLFDNIVLATDPRDQIAVLAFLGGVLAFLFASFRFLSPIYMTILPFMFVIVLLVTTRVPKRAAPGGVG